MDELTIGDKIYISSKKAAQITGYAKDYVGQLCRGGYVDARMVGRNWYVLESSIRVHRFGNETKKDQPQAEEGKIAGANPLHQGWEAPTYAPETAAVASMPAVAPKMEAIEVRGAAAVAEMEPSDTLTDMQEAWKEWFARKQEASAAPIQAPVVEEMAVEEPETAEEAEEELHAEPEEALEPEIEQETAAEEEYVPIRTVRTEERTEAYTAPQPVREAVSEAPKAIPAHEFRGFDAPRPVYTSYPSSAASVPVFDMMPSRQEEAVGRIIEERVVEKGAAPKRRPVRSSRTPSNLLVSAALVALTMVAVAVTVLGTGFGDTYNYRTGAQYAAIHFFNGAAVYEATKP